MAHLGEILSELRQDRGLTQKELGEIMNVSPGTISNYENGVHLPDAEKLIALADFFGVTTDYLLARTPHSIPAAIWTTKVTKHKTLADLIAIFSRLPEDRQQALALIISDMEINLMIDAYQKRGDA